MSRSCIFWVLVCIVIVGTTLRSYDLTARSIWFDEAFSWRLITFPFFEMITRDSLDVHPPLYYIFLQGWAYVFGSSLVAMRAFSIACSALSLVSAYIYAAYAFCSKRAGFYTVTFLALSPWAISYASETRMYPLGMVFALLSSYALLRGLREKSLRWFGIYGVLGAALAYTHYYGFFTIAAQVLFVCGVLVHSTKWRIGEMVQARVFWGGVLSMVVAGVLFSPWLSTFLDQRSQVQETFWIPPFTISSVSDTFYQFFIPTLQIPRQYKISHIPLTLTVLVMLYAFARYRKIDGVWLTSLLATIPILISILVSLTGRSLYNDRYFAFTGIFLFVFIAYIVSAITRPVVRRILFLSVLAGLLFTHIHYARTLDIPHKGGVHAATKYVFTHRTNDEPVVVQSSFIYFPVLHYATEEFSAYEVPRLYSSTGELSHFSGGPILVHENIVGPKDIAVYKGTVWVVDTTGFGEQPLAVPSNWKEESHEVFHEVFPHQGDVVVRKFTVVSPRT